MLSADCQSGWCHKYGHQYRRRSHCTAIGPSSLLQHWLRLWSLQHKVKSWHIARWGRCQLSCPVWDGVVASCHVNVRAVEVS
eukprot:10322903-Lingulodinium_polyedra.AAC.1